MCGEQWNRLDAGLAQHVEERGNLDARGAVTGEHLRPTMQVDRAEGVEIRAKWDEGVGFLHEGADGDAHVFLCPSASYLNTVLPRQRDVPEGGRLRRREVLQL